MTSPPVLAPNGVHEHHLMGRTFTFSLRSTSDGANNLNNSGFGAANASVDLGSKS